jgi:predicted phosphodiesterase
MKPASVKLRRPDWSKWLVLPDTHAPQHDKRAVALVQKVIDHWQPWGIIVQGDFTNNDPLSAHTGTRKVNRARWKDEIVECRRLLAKLTGNIPERHFCFGNHETRLERLIAAHVPALEGALDQGDWLGLKDWTSVTDYNETLKLGKLNHTHDTGKSGWTAARTAAIEYMSSACIGHTHAVTYTVIGRPEGPPVLGASFGWLGDYRQVSYVHRIKAKQWPLGFGTFRMDKRGVCYVTPVPIINYTCCVEGTRYAK